jgi:DNA-binding protein HU-beta
MNRQELIDAVAGRSGYSKAATGEAIDSVLAAIVTTGNTGQLVGFAVNAP